MKVYPEHLYEPVRVKVATDYVKAEMRKMLAGVRGGEVWKAIDKDIDSWWSENDEVKVRNFWNGVHGIGMGFKLKIGLIQMLTAENVEWRLEPDLRLDERVMSGGGYPYIHEQLAKGPMSAEKVRRFFSRKENRELKEKWKEEFIRHGNSSEPRDKLPIMGIEEDTGIMVHDGNRRMILGVLENRESLAAYVGRYKTEEKGAKNFWLPSSWLMELVLEGELANNFEETAKLLKNLIKLSESGEYELRERVLIGGSEFRKRLREELGWE